MRTRALAGLVAATALVAAACGGGDSGPSDDDFRADLARICTDFKADTEDVDQPDGSDAGDFEAFAQDVRDVFDNVKSDLADLEAPDDLSDDYDKFKGLVDDEIDELDDLEKAGRDEDADAINAIAENISDIQDEARGVADDLDVDECKPSEPATEDTTPEAADSTAAPVTLAPTVPETAPATTAAPPTTVPAATLPPATLPPVTLPATTAPPQTTAAPQTTPAPSAPPDTDLPVLFDIMDIPARFNSFPPYTLGPPTAEGEQNFIDIVASETALNLAIDEMGVAVIRDETGDAVATIVIGFAVDESIGVPNEWKNLICDPDVAEFYTTEGGNLGVYCEFFDDQTNPIYEVFSATTTELGFTVATLTPFVTLDELVDGFVEANT
jgi:hypothetical protein